MRANIHPQVFTDTKVICGSCGNTFTTTSTRQEIKVEVCSKCHPFYTGEHRFIDTQGRVEKFQQKQKVAAETLSQRQEAKKARKERGEYEPKSLKELLGEV